MNVQIPRYIRQFAFFIAGLACFAAQADYSYITVNYPGAISTTPR